MQCVCSPLHSGKLHTISVLQLSNTGDATTFPVTESHPQCLHTKSSHAQVATQQCCETRHPALQHVCSSRRDSTAERDVKVAQPLAVVPYVDQSCVREVVTVGQVKVSQTLAAGGHCVNGSIRDTCTLLELWNVNTQRDSV